jgi:hypothetical protein
MLTGEQAFRRASAAETMTAILREDIPELPSRVAVSAREVVPVLAHCVEKRPEDRFQSARDLAISLRTASGSAGTALNYDPVYSPDGSEIAFASNVGGEWQIYRQRLSDGQSWQVTFGPGPARYPDYRPRPRSGP